MLKEHGYIEQDPFVEFSIAINNCKRLAQNRQYIDTFFIHGSRVIGCHSPYSDLDIAFVVNDESGFNLLRQDLFSLFDFDPNMMNFFKDESFDYWHLEGKEIGVHVFSVEEFNSRKERIFTSVQDYENLSAWAQHIIIESKPEVAKSSILDTTKNQVETIPYEFQLSLISTYLERTQKRLRWFEKRPFWKSPFEELFDVTLILEDVIRCQYALNGLHYMPGLKQYFYDAQNMQPDISSEIVAFMEFNPEPVGRFKAEKQVILQSVFDKLQSEFIQLSTQTVYN